jgi:hypothetical protein
MEYTPEFKAAFLKAITKGTDYENAPFLFLCVTCGNPDLEIQIEDLGKEEPPMMTFTCPVCGNSATWVPEEYTQETRTPKANDLIERINQVIFTTTEEQAEENYRQLLEFIRSEYGDFDEAENAYSEPLDFENTPDDESLEY